MRLPMRNLTKFRSKLSSFKETAIAQAEVWEALKVKALAI
jgi:hypothetical protein